MLNTKFYKIPSFYITLVSVLFLIFGSVSYATFCSNIEITSTYNVLTLIFSIITFVVFVALTIFKPTFEIGKVAAWILSFVTFLIFINTIYMYFAGVFYNGVSIEAFQSMDKGVLISIIFYLLSCIIGNVAIYLNANLLKKEDK